MKAINKLLVLSSIALAVGCQSGLHNEVKQTPNATLKTLAALSAPESDIKLSYYNATGSFENGELDVQFDNSDHTYTSLIIEPKTSWDWSDFKDFNLAFDIANNSERSTQIYLDITDGNGDNYTRSVSIPRGGFKTYYAKMKGHDLATPEGEDGVELNFTSGLRSNPDTWTSDEVQFISLWGKKNLDLTQITRITISVQSALFDKAIQLKNIRLRANPEMDEKFLTGIVDKYGQNDKETFVGKVFSDQQLIDEKKAEKARFVAEKIADRSKFGGWASGPKFEATGYFRTEKTDGKWSMIDPEGHIYFASGIANIRLANTSTMTGYDFPSLML